MSLKRRLKELTLALSCIPSESGKEEGIQRFIAGLLEGMDVGFAWQEVPGCAPNLLVFFSERPKLLLATHVDTVPVSLGVFPPGFEGEVLRGVGVCDAKINVAILLLLVSEIRQWKRRPAVGFAFFVDEENEGRGSLKFSEEFFVPYGVVLEPTQLGVAVAEGGSVEFEVEVRGKSVHGSVAFRGENAAERAMKLVSLLKRLPYFYEEDPLVGPAGLNIEKFWSGDGLLRVPDRAELEIEVRVLPSQNLDEVVEDIKRVLEDFGGLSYRIKDVSEAFRVEEDSELVRAFLSTATRVLPHGARVCGMPSWTDAAHLVASGTQCVVFGPGDLTTCHTPEESVSVSEAELAFEVLLEFVKEFC